ncbi:mast cell protease 1A-like [Archocentrus centrarchus]|uniref:mast cell protease 1A-like n=1 Tax=Archocentrus centrarchus TaxID=63155 RepID=UPI0011EA201B|nr:mast cell protease 1A-like [Archocentrus centrarchus]
MMQALHDLLLLCLLTCVGQNAQGSEIINGRPVPESLMRYMASVQINGKHVCGGFLVSEDFVLTAAHCDKNSPMEVVLGTHNLKKVNNDRMRFSVKTCKHKYYDKVESGNDIMLLQLSRKVQLDKKVKPIQLAKKAIKATDNMKCLVAGWGFTATNGKAVDVLNQADVPLIDLNVCKKQWKFQKVVLPKGVLCAGGFGTKNGFCQGDSGGPLVCNGTAVGIVSFNMNGNCDYPNRPNVYTDISQHLAWIRNILKKKRC